MYISDDKSLEVSSVNRRATFPSNVQSPLTLLLSKLYYHIMGAQ